jgi:hypothetical protein
MPWTRRHLVLIWACAWGALGLSLDVAGVFDAGRTGPAWFPFVVGTLGWAGAGVATADALGASITPRRAWVAVAVWGAAFVWLASVALPFGAWLRQTPVGSFVPPGFAGMVIAWAAAAGLAVVVTARVVRPAPGLLRPLVAGFRWGFAFFFGGYIGVSLASIAGQIAVSVIGQVAGAGVAYRVGWTVACFAAGGLAAAGALTLSGSYGVSHDRRATDRPGARA